MIIRSAKVFIVALGLLISSFCAAEESYRLAVQVERNGATIVDATADVEAAARADLQSSNAAAAVETRVIARVTPQQSGSDIAIQLQYFEKINEDWVLLGEPALVASLGSEADVQFEADSVAHRAANRYELRLTVTSNGPNALPSSGSCTDQEFPMLATDGADPKCCSTKAMMTCCTSNAAATIVPATATAATPNNRNQAQLSIPSSRQRDGI